MNERYIYVFENRRGIGSRKVRQGKALGYLTWSPRKGLIWVISNRRLQAALKRAVEDRIKEGQYYVVAAVRSG